MSAKPVEWYWLIIIGFAIGWVIAGVGRANAAIPSAIPTENAVESDKPKTSCIQATTRQRYSVTTDGKVTAMGGYTIWETCK